jgi:hypothetical protein
MKKLWLLALTVALASLNMPAFADDSMEDLNQAIGSLTNRVSTLEKKPGVSVDIHGFVQSDFINTTTESFAETVGDGAVSRTAPNTNNGNTQFSLRNSRISLLGKESAGDWNFKGYVEADFLGIPNGSGTLATGGSEYKYYTQPTLRMRHAYVEGDTNDGWQILAGQYWTLFGWDMDYVLATVAEAPVMGTLYERIPQVMVKKTVGDEKGMQVQLAVSAEKPDQDIAQIPNLNAGVRLVMNDMKGYFCGSTGATKLQPLSVGLSERNAEYAWNDPNTNPNNVFNATEWGSAVAADALIPILMANEGKDDASIVLTGEWTVGAGDTLAFNGGGFGGGSKYGTFPSPTVTTTGAAGYTTELDGGEGVFVAGSGLVLQQLESYNAQLQITLPRSIGTIFTGGYGEVFGLNGNALGESYNDDSNYFVNVMQDVSKSVRVAAEYSMYSTHYTTVGAGQVSNDQRFQVSTWYRF